eukprot:3105266-Amphidinium_carterae.1
MQFGQRGASKFLARTVLELGCKSSGASSATAAIHSKHWLLRCQQPAVDAHCRYSGRMQEMLQIPATSGWHPLL